MVMIYFLFILDCTSTPGIICVGGDGIVNEVSHCLLGENPVAKDFLLHITSFYFLPSRANNDLTWSKISNYCYCTSCIL